MSLVCTKYSSTVSSYLNFLHDHDMHGDPTYGASCRPHKLGRELPAVSDDLLDEIPQSMLQGFIYTGYLCMHD